jgi:protein SCO1/2
MRFRPRARHDAGGLVGLLVALGALWLGFCARPASAHQLSPDELREIRVDQQLGAQLPLGLEFRDEAGRQRALSSFFGERPVVLTFNYLRCQNLCSTALQSLANRLRTLPLALGEQYTVLTVSIDPRETPAEAAEKRATLVRGLPDETASDWHFLTGDEAAIAQLTAAAGFRYVYDAQEDEYVHPTGLIVLTPGGLVSRYLSGADIAPKDLRLALIEAGQRRIGSLVEQLTLLCYHYDPTTGRYTPIVLDAVRLAGLATVAGVGLFLGRLWRDDLRGRSGRLGPVS